MTTTCFSHLKIDYEAHEEKRVEASPTVESIEELGYMLALIDEHGLDNVLEDQRAIFANLKYPESTTTTQPYATSTHPTTPRTPPANINSSTTTTTSTTHKRPAGGTESTNNHLNTNSQPHATTPTKKRNTNT